MTESHANLAIRTLVEAALPAINEMPVTLRADCYDGIFVACRDHAPDLALIAQKAATALRDAESLQLQFGALLASASNPSPEARA